MSTILDTLMAAGLHPSAAQVYIILIENGEMTVPQMLEKTELSRAMIYEVLPELMAGGYVEYRKAGREAYYRPVHPQKLLDLINQKKRDVALLEDEMKQTINTLSGTFNLAFHKPGVRFFEGVEGLKSLYEETLREPKPIYALLSPGDADPTLRDWLNDVYVKQRVAKGIHASVIASSSTITDDYRKYDKDALRDVLVIPDTKFPVDIEINIFGNNRVAFISYRPNEMVGVLMDSPAVYVSMKTFFDLAWQEAKKYNQSSPARPPILD